MADNSMKIASDIYELARQVVSGVVKSSYSKPDISDSVYLISLGLFTKMFRLHGAILNLVQSGYEDEADIFLRTLLETSLALDFVLRPTLTLVERGMPLIVDPEKELSRDFRASLYQTHHKFEINRSLRAKDRAFGTSTYEEVKLNTVDEEAIIGPLWVQRLKKRRYYSGTSISDLAESLGQNDIFRLIYTTLSRYAHACDWSQFVETIDESGRIVLRWEGRKRLLRSAFVAGSGIIGAAGLLLTEELGISSPALFAKCLSELKDVGK